MIDLTSSYTNGFYSNYARNWQLKPNIDYNNVSFGNSSFKTFNQAVPINMSTVRQTSDKTLESKELSTASKVGIGVFIATGLAIGADYLFCRGKHVNSLLKAFRSEQKQVIKESENLADDIATSVKKAEIKFAKEAETKTAEEAKIAGEKVAKEAEAKLATEKVAKEAEVKVVEEVKVSAGKSVQEKLFEQNENISIKEFDKVFDDVQTGVSILDGDLKGSLNVSLRNKAHMESIGVPIKSNFAEDIEKRAATVDKMFKKATPFKHDQVVYRGISTVGIQENQQAYYKMLENIKPGETFIPDAGYQFVSWNKSLASRYAGGKGEIFFEIRIPKGTKMLHHDVNAKHYNGANAESILPRNAKMKLQEVFVDEIGVKHMVVELIK